MRLLPKLILCNLFSGCEKITIVSDHTFEPLKAIIFSFSHLHFEQLLSRPNWQSISAYEQTPKSI